MTVEKIEIIELPREELERLLERAKAVLDEKDYQNLEKLVKSFLYVTRLLEEKGTTVRELRKLLFGMKSEKLRDVLNSGGRGTAGEQPAASEAPGETGGGDAPGGEPQAPEASEAKPKPKGHGRNGAKAYAGAEKIYVPHETLKPGDPCPVPDCTGKVYEQAQPSVLVWVVGRAPLGATVIERQQLRCNLCLEVFTAKMPAGVGPQKYDATAGSMIALLRYGTGVPFNRLEGLQANFKIPLPAATQWDVVEATYKRIAPAYDELMREAAQGDVLHNDDTPMKILELLEENKKKKEKRGDG